MAEGASEEGVSESGREKVSSCEGMCGRLSSIYHLAINILVITTSCCMPASSVVLAITRMLFSEAFH